MTEEVEPFLATRQEELWFTRSGYQKLHCMKYLAEDAKGSVLISHGFTESAEKYLEVIYYFVKAHYHVFVVEHCGHGYSYRLCEELSKVHIDDHRRYVEDLAHVAQYIRKECSLPLYLFAHSMGGAIGALTAAKYPELFDKVLLTSPMIRPAVGSIPWTAIKAMSGAACLLGKRTAYIPGHHAYEGLEAFESSCSTSRERFDYYNEKKATTKAYQTSGATYGWMYQTTKIYHSLMKKAVKQIKKPVLLIQAGADNVVSLPDQKLFIQKLRANGNTNARLITIQNAKHEIYNSVDEDAKKYWRLVFSFLS